MLNRCKGSGVHRDPKEREGVGESLLGIGPGRIRSSVPIYCRLTFVKKRTLWTPSRPSRLRSVGTSVGRSYS